MTKNQKIIVLSAITIIGAMLFLPPASNWPMPFYAAERIGWGQLGIQVVLVAIAAVFFCILDRPARN